MQASTPWRRGTRWAVTALVAVLGAACGGGTRPPASPPASTVVEATPVDTAAPAEPAPRPEPPPVLRPPAPRVVIEPAEPDPDGAPTLAEAARRERLRRRSGGEPTIVITDANLQDHAVGQLTFMADDEESQEAGETGAEGDEEEDSEGPDEQYWRDRVREIRQRWADAAGQLPQLQEQVTELRRRFYEADDSYYRDSRIKPAWDRAIDLIAQTRAEIEAHRQELVEVLEEGRLAGALPGWLREGIELEPEPVEEESPTHEPGEPVIVEPVEGPPR